MAVFPNVENQLQMAGTSEKSLVFDTETVWNYMWIELLFGSSCLEVTQLSQALTQLTKKIN